MQKGSMGKVWPGFRRLLGSRCCRGLAWAVLLVFFLVPAVGAQEKYPVAWDKAASETMEYFQSLIRLDTTNPPGNESKVAEYVKGILEKEGINAKLLALNPSRANLVARIRGNGSKRPILIMGHSDVVGVQKEKWLVDPFAAVRKDGYIWGRGTTDDKDNIVAGLMTMLMLKRLGVKLDRDVIFLIEAGEEGYHAEGLRHVMSSHWEEINAEFALAEGGAGIIKDGKVQFVSVATTEKYRWRIQLTAKGQAGHGSQPRPGGAIYKLADAVSKIGAFRPEMKLSETTRAYFEQLAKISPPEAAARYRAILDPAKRAEAEKYFAEHEPQHNSMIRTTLAATVFKGGFRDNVIPSEAEATIDIRALPEEDMVQFRKRLEEVIGDPSIEIKPITGRDKAPASKLTTEMWAALEKTQKRLFPEATLMPLMLTGASDLSPLRGKGIQAYGIGPLVLEKDEKEGIGAHSDNERVLESALQDFVKFMWYAVTEVAATK